MADQVGKQLGNYRIVRLLGQGGFASVYLGEHIHLKTQAAIKIMSPDLMTPLGRETFLVEAQTIARLEHPHIVRLLDFGIEGEIPFLVMTYASGGTLRHLYPRTTQLPLATILNYVKPIAQALQYAHSFRLIHRDIKPANILVGRQGEVLVSDFGTALALGTQSFQTQVTTTGTPQYMSPEQSQGKPLPASDQYSLGIVVYEWLTGETPFRGTFLEILAQHSTAPVPSLRALRPEIPSEVEEVVRIALAKSPSERFASVSSFAIALEQAIYPDSGPIVIEQPLYNAQEISISIQPTIYISNISSSSVPTIVSEEATLLPDIQASQPAKKAVLPSVFADRNVSVEQPAGDFANSRHPLNQANVEVPKPGEQRGDIEDPRSFVESSASISENAEDIFGTRPLEERFQLSSRWNYPPSNWGIVEAQPVPPVKIPEEDVVLPGESVRGSPQQTSVFDYPAITIPVIDFFISYTKVDLARAYWLADCLHQQGFSTFLPPVDFREGFIFRKEMLKAHLKAKRMITILSPAYFAALQSRSGGWDVFKRAMKRRVDTFFTVCVNIHEALRKELFGLENYIDIVDEDAVTAQQILLAYVNHESIGDLQRSFSPITLSPQMVDLPLQSASSFVNSPISTLVQQIHISFTRQDWPDVIRKVDFLLNNYPILLTSAIYRMYGQALSAQNNQAQAYEALRTALTLVNGHERLPLLSDCANISMALNFWPEVLNYAQEALQLTPQSLFWQGIQQQASAQLEHEKQLSQQKSLGITVFFSYSHSDEKMRLELEKHLALIKREHMITGWHDGEIRAGDVWEEEIDEHLSQASIVLLLVSPDFLHSKYCYEKEMIRAVERHKAGLARVIPIILRPSNWKGAPFSKFQVLPLEGKAITLWQNMDEAYASVARGIQHVLDEFTKESH